MSPTRLASCGALVACCVSGVAHADECPAPGDSVHVSIRGAQADVRVQRSIYNPTEELEVRAPIVLPQAAALVSLRARPVGEKRGWFSAGLMDAGAASDLYGRLTGRPGGRPGATLPISEWVGDKIGVGKDPVLAVWSHEQEVALQLFPLGQDERQTIEYAFTTDLVWDGQAYVLDYNEPLLGACGKVKVDVRKTEAGHLLGPDDNPVARRFETEDGVTLRFEPSDTGPLLAHAASIETDEGFLSRYRIDVRDTLAQAPTSLDVVMLIDESRSMGTEGAIVALANAQDYANALRDLGVDARIGVATFSRQAHALASTPLTPGEVRERLPEHTMALAHGTNLQVAFEYAADWFDANAREGVERRVMLFSDLRTARAVTPERARDWLAHSEALTHIDVVTTEQERGKTPQPALDHPWHEVAAVRGGLVWTGGYIYHGHDWVTPQHAIDARLVDAEGKTLVRVGDGNLEVKESYSVWMTTAASLEGATLRASLWSQPIEADLRTPRGYRKHSAAVGAATAVELGDESRMALAQLGHAVSPVTSLIAVEPGARPTEVAPELEVSPESDTDAPESETDPGRAPVRLAVADPSRVPWLQRNLWDRWRACGLSDAPITATLETTGDEIVVFEMNVAGGMDPESVECGHEAVWGLTLPKPKFEAAHEAWTIEVEPLPLAEREAAGLGSECFHAARVSVSTSAGESRVEALCGRLGK